MANPLISVILAVYNNQDELPSAITSLLNQSFTDFEIIAINDGSKDRAGEILDQFAKEDSRIRVIHQENQGLGHSLARGCSEAKGQFLARQDADDLSAANRLGSQAAFLESNPSCVLCGCWTWFADSSLREIFASEVPNNPKQLKQFLDMGMNPFVHGSVMIRREAYQRLKTGYRFSNPFADLDLWMRMSAEGELGMLESVGYYYRIHTNSITASTFGLRKGLIRRMLTLHQQRQDIGIENPNSLIELNKAIELARASKGSPEDVALYSSAIEHLRSGDIVGYQKRMKEAAIGDGLIARKAQWHLKLSIVPQLVSAWYRWRLRNSPGRYFRILRSTEKLPPEIAHLWFAANRSTTAKPFTGSTELFQHN